MTAMMTSGWKILGERKSQAKEEDEERKRKKCNMH